MDITSVRCIDKIYLRSVPSEEDKIRIKEILLSTSVFLLREINVAVELIEDRLKKGIVSEYLFIFADIGNDTVGYICYGPITMSENRFDIYWIAVKKDMQCKEIGSLLLSEAEKNILGLGALHIFVETSSRDIYKPTRDFYRKHGYFEVARIPNYYTKNDDKVVLMKSLFSSGQCIEKH